jgi:hypothetical protein
VVAVAAPSPQKLRDAFIGVGYGVVHEDENIWVLGMYVDDDPLILPKHGDKVAPDILDYTLDHASENGLRDQIVRSIASRPPPP